MKIIPTFELEKFKLQAYQFSPQLKQIRHKKEILKAKKIFVNSEFMPNVVLFGRYELYKNDLTILEPKWAVGIGLKLNLFNGLSDLHEDSAVNNETLMAAELERNSEDLVQINIEKIFSDLKGFEEQYQSLLKSQVVATENLKLNSNAFAHGMAKNTDVIDAELTLASVKLATQKSLFDYNISLAQLYAFSGQTDQILLDYAK